MFVNDIGFLVNALDLYRVHRQNAIEVWCLQKTPHDIELLLPLSKTKHHDNIINNKPPCKLNLDASNFNSCMFYVVVGFYRKRTFLTYENTTTTPIRQLSLLHPSRGPPCKYTNHYNRDTVTPVAAYTVHAVCQLRSRSRRSVKFAGGPQIYYAAVEISARRVTIVNSTPA